MAAQEQNGKEENLNAQQGFRENAFKIIMKMQGWSSVTPRSKHLVDEILHSILFLGKINSIPFSPNEIISDGDILEALMAKYPRPFQFYLTQLPRRSPFSCVLDMIVLLNSPANEEQIKESLRDLINDLAPHFLVSSTICISQKSKTDQSSKRYYGVSMSTNRRNPRTIVIAASCLSKWDEYVSGAVMTYYPNNVMKDYFDATIEVPGNIRCEAFSLSRDEQMSPCRSCHNLFGLNTEETTVWHYGNCAEAESLSKLLTSEEEVKNETHVHEHSAENRQRAEEEVRRALRNVLRMIHFNTWTGEFYNPEMS
ncbi:glutathione synthase [Sarotherodon galilaeus]